MATKLSQLTLQGFRSFDAQTTISFPESGLVLFQGPSGAGKSTVLMGIAHALGYSPYPATELKSWLSENPMEVKLALKGTVEGDATIVRGTTTALYTDKGDTRGASAVNAKLPLLMGMDTDLLAALTYRPQKTPGLFLSKTNSEMQEFLTTLLQLGKYEKAIDDSQEQVKTLTTKYAALVDDVARAMSDVVAIEAELIADPQDEAPFKRQVVEANILVENHKQAVEAVEEEIKDYKAEWEAKLKQVKGTRAIEDEIRGFKMGGYAVPNSTTRMLELDMLIPQAKARLAKLEAAEKERAELWEAAIEDAKNQIRKYDEAIKSLPKLLSEKLEYEEDIAKLKSAICPRCAQPWLDGKLESELVQAGEDLEYVEDRIHTARNADLARDGWMQTLRENQAKLAEVDPKIAQFKEAIAAMSAEHLAERAKLNEQAKTAEAQFAAQLAQERLAIEKQVNQVNHVYQVTYDAKLRVLDLARRELATAIDGLNEANTALLVCQSSNRDALKNHAAHELRRSKAKQLFNDRDAKAKATKDALDAEQDFLELLKSFLTAIFDEVLAEIAWNANEMLRNVPNVAHVTVGFRSESTTAKGTVKRALIPYVTLYGVERNPKTALSGGMATAVDLAVDLAVRKVITARTGHKPGWLVLDECFEGLGMAEKEACMGLLQQAAHDTLILVVDHMTEFKEMFSQRFTVTATNGRSQIESEA